MNDPKESYDAKQKRDEEWNEIVSRFSEYFCRYTPDAEEFYHINFRSMPPFDLFKFSASTLDEWRNVMRRYAELYELADTYELTEQGMLREEIITHEFVRSKKTKL